MADKVINQISDVCIIGSGPAGLSASVYASRAGLKHVVYEKFPMSGGQIVNTGDVENYLGFSSVGGFDLAQKFHEHAVNAGGNFKTEAIKSIFKNNGVFEVASEKGEIEYFKTVIAATGAKSKTLGAKGEAEFTGKGVSYCAHCDGAFYRNKTAVVVGGGDTAVSDALYLSNLCKQVIVVHRRDEFRAVKSLVNKLEAKENVKIIRGFVLVEIKGDTKAESVILKSVKNNETQEFLTDGVFIAVGVSPVNELFKDIAETNEAGFLIANEDCKTSLEGLFVAGDLRAKPLKQIVTAVADGANAIYSAEKYLREN